MFENPTREQIIARAAALEASQVTMRCGHLAPPVEEMNIGPREMAAARAEYVLDNCQDCERTAFRTNRKAGMDPQTAQRLARRPE